MTEKCASPRWAWPITLDSYDRNPELSAEETESCAPTRRAWQTVFLLR